ncbi:hypothetical protein [Streptomyces sp. 150FB]|uniref:hypothetical protein n=1 Tax=Streptomyces sp. 150FB TaxID=1576605 RepID=UPI0006982523|nr:hypothetical protein [Streptomyces sp. 150FB]
MNPRTAFIGAPLLTFAYGVIRILDGLDGTRGPGLAWTTGHLAFVGAMALSVVAFTHMRALGGRTRLATFFVGVATLGALALTVQFGIDIVSGLLSDSHLAMSARTEDIQSFPGLMPLAYTVGPYLFYVGQVALVVQLALGRRIKAWTPLLVLVDMATPLIDKDLIPFGALLLLVSYVMILRAVRAAGAAGAVRPGAAPGEALPNPAATR